MAKKSAKPPEGESVNFEVALAELEEIVRALEDGEIGLSDSLARYEKGVRLLRQCYEMLDGAQRRIELLTGVDAEGRPIVASVDDSELTLTEKAERRSQRRGARRPGDSSHEGGTGGGTGVDAPQNLI